MVKAFRTKEGFWKTNRTYVVACALVMLLKLITWGLGYVLAITGYVDLDRHYYLYNFHHQTLDARVSDKDEIHFFSLWNYADAEWYLSIAQNSYPTTKEMHEARTLPLTKFRSIERDSYRKYLYFPLYPASVALFSLVLPTEAAAFFSNLLLTVASVVVFVYFFQQWFPQYKDQILWPLLFLFLFPFSLFYSLYYPEILFLSLSLLVFTFLKTKRYLLMFISGFLLSLTRPNGFLICVPVLISLIFRRKELRNQSPKENIIMFASAVAIPLGTVPYLALCYMNTGTWYLYLAGINQHWFNEFTKVIENVIGKFTLSFLNFADSQVHQFHYSLIESIMTLLSGGVILWMWFKKDFPRELTVWSTVIWLVPVLAFPYTTSFSRYMIVSFPVFIFLGLHLNRYMRYILITVFIVGYCIALKTVIQYTWLG